MSNKIIGITTSTGHSYKLGDPVDVPFSKELNPTVKSIEEKNIMGMFYYSAALSNGDVIRFNSIDVVIWSEREIEEIDPSVPVEGE